MTAAIKISPAPTMMGVTAINAAATKPDKIGGMAWAAAWTLLFNPSISPCS